MSASDEHRGRARGRRPPQGVLLRNRAWWGLGRAGPLPAVARPVDVVEADEAAAGHLSVDCGGEPGVDGDATSADQEHAETKVARDPGPADEVVGVGDPPPTPGMIDGEVRPPGVTSEARWTAAMRGQSGSSRPLQTSSGLSIERRVLVPARTSAPTSSFTIMPGNERVSEVGTREPNSGPPVSVPSTWQLGSTNACPGTVPAVRNRPTVFRSAGSSGRETSKVDQESLTRPLATKVVQFVGMKGETWCASYAPSSPWPTATPTRAHSWPLRWRWPRLFRRPPTHRDGRLSPPSIEPGPAGSSPPLAMPRAGAGTG